MIEPAGANRKRALARLAAAVAAVALLWWLAAAGVPGDIAAPETLAAEIRAQGALGPAVLAGLMVLAVLVGPVPTFPITVTAGLVFGPVWGTVYAVVGATAGALAAFGVARIGGRALVARLLGGHVAFCPTCSDRTLFAVVLLARLVPVVSFALVSYAAGLTAMTARAFTVATVIGMLPMTVVYVTLGASLQLSIPVFAATGVVVVVLLVAGPPLLERSMPRMAARLRDQWHGPTP